MKQNTALLIIDAQVNMFAPDHPVFESKQVLQKIKGLISRARLAHIPVV